MGAARPGLVDPEVVAQLKVLGEGQPGFFRELVQMYVEDSRKTLASIRTALGEHRAEGVRKGAHSLKGISAGVGATGLSQIAYELEKRAKGGDLSGAEAELEQLALANDRAIEELSAQCKDGE